MRSREPDAAARRGRLGYVAGLTEEMRLGLIVTGVSYRYLLAKIVTTLDVLSGGRAMLGICAAWYEREHIGGGMEHVQVSLLTDEPARFVESAIATLVPRLAEL